jgi:4-amino-4-deoxy-L-arabinose transferase-like glycosyltransferase
VSTTTPATSLPRPASRAGHRHLDIPDRVLRAAPITGLLVLTAVLYLWGLSRNGTANQYYAAAVQAGTHSWKAFLFGSLDAGNYITVDKPPASLWAIELSTRLFGFSSFSMLLPQALEGVAAVALLYATVRRWFSRPAALLSGLVLAITPVAALMFRFNNPDALLVLLLVAGAYSTTRAIEHGQTRWIALVGAALGFAFLTKMMQAFVVVPAFALVYLVAAPVPLRRRLWQLLVGGIALVASAGWWVALVELWPASARPYIGGSTDNSLLQLVFGYNGLGRISGGSGPGGGAGFSGAAGVLRLFNAELGGQIAWLLPASVIALGAGIVQLLRRRPARTDRLLATALLWGGWLIVTAVVYSFMSGTIHPYYTNTLAPPIAVLTGVGATLLWQRRERLMARVALAAMLAGTGVCAFVLLDRTPTWHPWLRGVVLGLSLAAALVLLIRGAVLRRTAAGVLAASALIAGLAAPAAFTLNAVASTQTGSNPSAGPASATHGGFGGPGGTPSGDSVSSTSAAQLAANASRYTWIAATSSAQTAAGIELATGKSVMAIGGFTGSDNAITLARFEQLVAQGKIHYYVSGGGGPSGGTTSGGSSTSGAPFGGARTGEMPSGFSRAGGPGMSGGVTQTIESWVTKHFKSMTVGGMTVYDLTQRTS